MAKARNREVYRKVVKWPFCQESVRFNCQLNNVAFSVLDRCSPVAVLSWHTQAVEVAQFDKGYPPVISNLAVKYVKPTAVFGPKFPGFTLICLPNPIKSFCPTGSGPLGSPLFLFLNISANASQVPWAYRKKGLFNQKAWRGTYTPVGQVTLGHYMAHSKFCIDKRGLKGSKQHAVFSLTDNPRPRRRRNTPAPAKAGHAGNTRTTEIERKETIQR